MSLEAKVLDGLSGDGYVSGEAISDRLNVSRSAVWKHIANLRRQGYGIEASPRLGYRLTRRPDKLLPAELQPRLDTRTIGSRIVHYDEVASTADVARELAGKRAPEGTVVGAESQTAGRGRLGRSWVTPPGTAIALSVVLYPPLSPSRAPVLSLAAGLATAQAVETSTGAGAQLKWPNDIYLNGKKLGGILVEMAAELDRVRWVIVSVGLNVNSDFRGTGLEGTATSLAAELGRETSRLDVAAALLNGLDRLYLQLPKEGFAAIRDGFEARDMLRGQGVEVRDGDRLVAGTASGIDDSGRLLVMDTDGATHALAGGEATITGITRQE